MGECFQYFVNVASSSDMDVMKGRTVVGYSDDAVRNGESVREA